jgi:CheY-like chemotaxis protein
MGEAGGLITLRTNTLADAVALTGGTVFEGTVSDGPHVCLEVEDTGPGMDEETAARIFDPFFTTKYTGHGLGLSTVHGVVRAHHGAVLVDSTPGLGTRFTLLFPAAEFAQSRQAAPPSPLWQGSGRVLVVEDDPPVRDVTCRLLERFGFSARPAASGAEAIACLKEGTNDYRAVILDYRMPLMSGYETFLEIRSMRPELPVLMVSGYTPDDITGRFHAAAPDAILQKPYSASSLLDALRGILSASDSKGSRV